MLDHHLDELDADNKAEGIRKESAEILIFKGFSVKDAHIEHKTDDTEKQRNHNDARKKKFNVINDSANTAC